MFRAQTRTVGVPPPDQGADRLSKWDTGETESVCEFLLNNIIVEPSACLAANDAGKPWIS